MGAVAGLVVGALTVVVWIALGWNVSFLGGPGVYQMIAGLILSMVAIVAVSLATEVKGNIDRSRVNNHAPTTRGHRIHFSV